MSATTSATRNHRLALLAATMATVAAMTACGGTGDSSPPPPPAPAPAPLSVTSTSVTPSTPGGDVLLVVNGTGLDSSLAVTSSTCSNVVRSTSSTSTTATYKCTTTAYAGTIVIASATGTTLSTASFAMPVPAVTSSSVAATRYGAKVLLTVVGANLDDGVTVTSPGCNGISLSTAAPNASSATTAYYTCTSGGGSYNSTFTFKNAFGAALGSATFTVPAPVVTMAVSGGGASGNIVFNLRADKAPVTVDNFLAYVNAGFYNGLIFHRVVSNFVVQGGGYGSTTTGNLPVPKATPFAPIKLETGGGSNVQWTAAMARTSDPNSATSQFFFNLANNASILDATSGNGGYAVFADVSGSAAVIQAIAAAPGTLLLNNNVPLGDGSTVPVPNVVITSAVQTQ